LVQLPSLLIDHHIAMERSLFQAKNHREQATDTEFHMNQESRDFSE
jgi:hypothetical protein